MSDLKAENQKLNVYINQLEREIIALRSEKNVVEVQLKAHITNWERQTGFTFIGSAGCASLYKQQWEEDGKVVRLRK